MSQESNDVTQINWLQQMAKDYMKQQKRQRYMKWGLRSLAFIFIVAAIAMGPSGPSNLSLKRPHVAVIDLEGGIFPKGPGNAERFIKALTHAFKNDNAKAVMIDINSPGGSPVQADEMYQALMAFRKETPKKKVIAICAEMCASAAYYVAAGADDIWANPSSLVGSIGVVSNGFGFTGAMEKLGITRRMVTAGKNKGFLDPFSPESEVNKERLQVMLDIVHDEFKKNVIAGRGKRLKINDETFSGLFWTGVQAKQMGLIDDFGNSKKSYKGLPRLAYSHKENLLEQLSKQLTESIADQIYTFINLPKLS